MIDLNKPMSVEQKCPDELYYEITGFYCFFTITLSEATRNTESPLSKIIAKATG